MGLKQFTSRSWMPWIDLILAFLAFVLAYVARYELEIFRPVAEFNYAPFDPYLPYVIVFAVWLHLQYRGSGLYRPMRGRPWIEEVYTIINGVANATIVLVAVSFFLQPLVFSRLMLIYAAAFAMILLSVARILQRVLQAYLRAKGIGIERVLIIGVGEAGQAVLRTMIARRELGYRVVGYLDDKPERGNVDLGRVRGLGNIERLDEVIVQEAVDLVVITLRWKYHDRILELIEICQRKGVNVRVVPDVFQLNTRQVQIENLDGIPLLGWNGAMPLRGGNRIAKRAIDLGLILLASPVLTPLFLLIALAIRLENQGPVFYTQKRVGEHGRVFSMFKFRSMIPDADKYRQQLIEQHNLDPRHPKIVDDPRITRVGRVIRRASLDELPNLINVIRGEMSLVGPRRRLLMKSPVTIHGIYNAYKRCPA